MTTQIIAVLCEGPHDVAFIYKILRTAGFNNIEGTKLGKYPVPINGMLCQEAKNTNVADLNLQQLKGGMLPLSTLQRDENYIFLYAIGGDGKVTERQQILKNFISFIPKEDEISVLPQGTPETHFSLLYFFDADNRGVQRRIAGINSELASVLGVAEKILENHSDIKVVNQLKLGGFIFTGSDNDTGALENTLFPLMQVENEDIFSAAESYLTKHKDESRHFPLKIKLRDGQLIEERSSKEKDKDYDELKSLIGLAGQLQRSGKPNTVYIRDSDYLTISKIQNSIKCQEIIAFFEKFVTT